MRPIRCEACGADLTGPDDPLPLSVRRVDETLDDGRRVVRLEIIWPAKHETAREGGTGRFVHDPGERPPST